MALPAMLAGFFSRMAIGEAATSAAGARATASAAQEASAVAKMNPQQLAQHKLNKTAQEAEGKFKKLNDTMGQVSQATQVGESKLHNFFTSWTTYLVGGLAAGATAVAAFAAPVRALVGIANPARAKMFDFAMQDALGVVGRELIPLMIAFTHTARSVGDTMAGLEPVFRPAIVAISEFVDGVGPRLNQIVQENQGSFQTLSVVLIGAAEAANYMAQNVSMLSAGINASRRFFGMGNLLPGMPTFDPNRTGMGAAAREARFTAPKDISNEAIKSALMVGAAGSVQDKQLSQLELIRMALERMEKKKDDNYSGADFDSGDDANDMNHRRLVTG